MKNVRTVIALTAIAVLVFAGGQASAAVLLYEGFSDGVNAADLNGYSGGTSVGVGTWGTAGNGAATIDTINRPNGPLLFPSNVLFEPTRDGDNYQWAEKNSGDGTWFPGVATAGMDTSLDFAADGLYYMSFLSRVHANDTQNMVGLTDGIDILSFGENYFWGATEFGFNYGVAPSSADSVRSGIGAANGQTYFVVAQFTTSAAGDDTVSYKAYATGTDLVHIDPSRLSGVGPGVDQWTMQETFTSDNAFDQLYGRSDGPGYPNIDEIRIGQSWSDVASVATLIWNGDGAGNWDSGNWEWPEGAPLPTARPDEITHTTVQKNIVSVVGTDAVASRLEVLHNGGAAGIAIAGNANPASAGVLSVVDRVRFEAGSTLEIGQNATLAVGNGGTLGEITTLGNATIDANGNALVGTTYAQSGAGSRVFTKRGSGTFSLDNTNTTNVAAANTVFRVEAGMLAMTGADPLGGATEVELAGGKLRVTAFREEAGTMPDIAGLQLHLDAGNINGNGTSPANGASVGTWGDLSGSNNNATGHGEVHYVDTGLNPVVRFDGNNDYFSFPEITDIRTAFWVLKEDADAPTDFRPLLGHSDGEDVSHFHRGVDKTFWATAWGASEIVDGVTQLNGEVIDGTTTQVPTELSVVSLQTTGGVPADYIGRDRDGWASRCWDGDYAEILVYNTVLTGQEVADVNGYLTRKYSSIEDLDLSTTNVTVSTPNSTLEAMAGSLATFGTLKLAESGILTTTGAAQSVVFSGGTTVDASATGNTVGIDPQIDTVYGTVDGSAPAAAFNFAKTGPGSVLFEAGGTNQLSNMTQATIEARDGTLAVNGAASLGGATELLLSGGKFSLTLPSPGPLAITGPAISVNFAPSMGSLDATDTAGFFPAENWNNADQADRQTGVSEMLDNSGVATTADVTWDEATIWQGGAGATPDERMMHGYLDRSSSATVSEIPFDNYVVYAYMGSEGSGGNQTPLVKIGDQEFYYTSIATDGTYVLTDDSTGAVKPTASYAGFGLVGSTFTIEQIETGNPGGGLTGLQIVQTESAPAVDISHLNVAVTEDSVLDLSYRGEVLLGDLVLSEGTLSTDGMSKVRFKSTTISLNQDVTEVGINPGIGTRLGPLDGSAAAVSIFKTGENDLVLQDAGTNLQAATFDVRQGRLIGLPGQDPFGTAALQVGDGELVLAANETDTSPVAWDVAVTETSSGILTAGSGAVGGAHPAGMTVQVGSVPDHGVTVLTDATLQLRSTGNYTLEVIGPVAGEGTLDVSEGNVVLSGGGDVGGLHVSGGAVSLTADVHVGSVILTGGSVDTGDATAVISERLQVGEDVSFLIEGGHTFEARSANALLGGELTLSNGGTLTIDGGPWTPGNSIAVNFAPANGALAPTDVAGFIPRANWNAADQAQQAVGISDLLDDSGTVTTADVTWDDTVIWQGGAGGTPDQRMLHGYLDRGASATVSEVPFENYAVFAYMGSEGNGNATSRVKIGDKEFFYTSMSSTGEYILTEDLVGDVKPTASYAVFSLMSDPSFTLEQIETGNPGGGMTGLQIVEQIFPQSAEVSTMDVVVTQDAEIAAAIGLVTLGNLTVQNPEGPQPATTLTLSGAQFLFADVSAADGVTLDGEMEVRGELHVGGDSGIGTLTLNGGGELALDTSANFNAQVSMAAAGAVADKIDLVNGALQLGGTLTVTGIERADANTPANALLTVVAKGSEGEIGYYDSDADVLYNNEFESVVPAPAADASSHIGQGAFLREVDYKPATTIPAHTTTVELDVFVALGGDADGDGKVWLTDWAALRANFGNTGTGKTWTEGNFDPWVDDKVWLSDWAALRANFGNA
ncbi:MAG: hypothetical protein HQ567_12995, partial [Candidatus Nealsonbacteria bacterium]|nr:hypothetical protein [Candidatus Nealsonbacteria bacterium]